MLGTSLAGAQAAFVLTTGQDLSTDAAAQCVPSTEPAGTGADASAAAADVAGEAADPPAAAAAADGVGAQHERLRQRLAAAAAAAQARQRVAQSASSLQAGNPALEAAAAAQAAGVMQPPNVARLRLWNPLTGQCVPVRDPACELREVRADH